MYLNIIIENMTDRRRSFRFYNRLIGNHACTSHIDNANLLEYKLPSLRSSKRNLESCPIFSCRFKPGYEDHILATCTESGDVCLYNTLCSEDNSKFCLKRFQAHQNAVFDIAWMSSNSGVESLVTVSGDRTAALWDCRTGTKISSFSGHTGSIKTVSACPDDNNIFVTGSRDRSIRVWDCRNRARTKDGIRPVNVIDDAHPSNFNELQPFQYKRVRRTARMPTTGHKAIFNSSPITSVLFHDQFSVISGACIESQIRCWDLRRTYSFLKTIPTPSRSLTHLTLPKQGRRCGYSNFSSDAYRSSLFAFCTDGVLYEYSLTSALNIPIARYGGASVRSFYVQCAACPTSPFVVGGSSDGSAYIWRLGRQNGDLTSPPVVRLYDEAHQDEVTGVAWNSRMVLATCSDDFSWRLWKLAVNTDSDTENDCSINTASASVVKMVVT